MSLTKASLISRGALHTMNAFVTPEVVTTRGSIHKACKPCPLRTAREALLLSLTHDNQAAVIKVPRYRVPVESWQHQVRIRWSSRTPDDCSVRGYVFPSVTRQRGTQSCCWFFAMFADKHAPAGSCVCCLGNGLEFKTSAFTVKNTLFPLYWVCRGCVCICACLCS